MATGIIYYRSLAKSSANHVMSDRLSEFFFITTIFGICFNINATQLVLPFCFFPLKQFRDIRSHYKEIELHYKPFNLRLTFNINIFLDLKKTTLITCKYLTQDKVNFSNLEHFIVKFNVELLQRVVREGHYPGAMRCTFRKIRYLVCSTDKKYISPPFLGVT